MTSMELSRRRCLATLVLAVLFAASCGSCESCTEEPDDEPDTTTIEEPEEPEEDAEDELAEASAQAEELGDTAAFNVEESARFLASELEGLSAEVDDPTSNVRTKSAPRPRDRGEIDVGQVQRVFAKHRSGLQVCYERALKRDPLLQGQVVLTLRIGSGGEPVMTSAQSKAMPDEAALKCMEREAKNWLFPRPKGGTVLLNKPFRFTPQN